MLAPEVLRLTQETVQELHAQGREERARAVEALLAVAAAALTGQHPPSPRAYYTPAQAAQVLGVRRRTVEGWVASGQLQAVRLGDETLIHRDSLLSFLKQVRDEGPTSRAPTPQEEDAAQRRRTFVVSGLPAEQVARLEALHERLERGQRLSGAERRELVALEREVAAAAGQRLKAWGRQLRSAAT